MNVQITSDGKFTIPLDEIVGTFRSFGPVGPVYEVLSVSDAAQGADFTARIRVVTTGEALDYPVSDILADPVAR